MIRNTQKVVVTKRLVLFLWPQKNYNDCSPESPQVYSDCNRNMSVRIKMSNLTINKRLILLSVSFLQKKYIYITVLIEGFILSTEHINFRTSVCVIHISGNTLKKLEVIIYLNLRYVTSVFSNKSVLKEFVFLNRIINIFMQYETI